MFLFITGLPRFTERSLNDLRHFLIINNIEEIYACFWSSSIESKNKIKYFSNYFPKANIYSLKEEDFSSRGLFKWIDFPDLRIERQYFILNWLVNKLSHLEGVSVRYRSDIEWYSIPRLPREIPYNAIFTTPIEGHEIVPFEPSICNDQFYVSDFSTIKKIMCILNNNSYSYLHTLHLNNLSRISMRHSIYCYKGIEGLLFEVLFKLNINIYFTHAFYRLALKKKPSQIVQRILLFESDNPHIFFRLGQPSRFNIAYILNYLIWFFSKKSFILLTFLIFLLKALEIIQGLSTVINLFILSFFIVIFWSFLGTKIKGILKF